MIKEHWGNDTERGKPDSKFGLKSAYKFSSCLTESTVNFRYKDQTITVLEK
jgi:hypothetical protein